MSKAEALKLSEVIDVDAFMRIQEKLAKLVNFSVVTVDANGVPIGKWSNFSPFCKLVRSSPKGAERCISCDYNAGLLAVNEGKPLIYKCHLGLQDCVAPIIINGNFLGSVLGGQVLLRKNGHKSINAKLISEEFQLPYDEVVEAAESIPVVTRKYLEECIDFYTFMSNYIAEISMNKIVQEELLRESQVNLILEQKAKKLELKKIQAQINPHFLFNTLNTIARMALMEDAPRTEELIYNLCDLLRYNLKNVEEFPKIRSEIENIQKYLYIQTLRFSDRISYKLDVDPAILDFRIPSMVLQPIVENSIIHGLEQKKEGGVITISGKRLNKTDLILSVSDNGKGFNPDFIRLFDGVNDMPNKHSGIGLVNTHDRIRLFFGSNYGIHIESQPDSLSMVHIMLPCLKKDPTQTLS